MSVKFLEALVPFEMIPVFTRKFEPIIPARTFFPDRLGMAKGEGRIIVNDSMEIATLGVGVNASQQVTVVMECQVVKLTEKDYITLAMQQVADN